MILDGKKIAADICGDLKERVVALREKGVSPKLTVVTSGHSGAGSAYLKSKEKLVNDLNINLVHLHYPCLNENDFDRINNNEPIIYQTPLCGFVETGYIAHCMGPEADMDGVSDINVHALAIGDEACNTPCTAEAVVEILKRYEIPVSGRSVCMIGRSNTVGRPLARMLEHMDATVTLCHSKTPKDTLYHAVELADIIISATGCPDVITRSDIIEYGFEANLKYQTYIDVGIIREENGIRGDLDPGIFEDCMAYTPVPGGVGPVTTALLMRHVVEFYEKGLQRGVQF